jgi:hypothetical protein
MDEAMIKTLRPNKGARSGDRRTTKSTRRTRGSASLLAWIQDEGRPKNMFLRNEPIFWTRKIGGKSLYDKCFPRGLHDWDGARTDSFWAVYWHQMDWKMGETG